MSSLKELRNRQRSTKDTRKITFAMKMISAAKLKRAQLKAEQIREYANSLSSTLLKLSKNSNAQSSTNSLTLLNGTGNSKIHLIVVVTSSRGLCGGFNSIAVRTAIKLAEKHIKVGGVVKFICIGQKGADQLKAKYKSFIEKIIIAKPNFSFDNAISISNVLQKMLKDKVFDICTIIFSKFISALSQELSTQQLIPFSLDSVDIKASNVIDAKDDDFKGLLEYEPNESTVLSLLLPRNLNMQIYRAIIENLASEHGARMTAMDGATRNADDMIKKLQLTYNRTRQAYITKELIEIISGAEAI